MAWTLHLLVWITVCGLSNLQLTNGTANKKFDDPAIVFPGPIQSVSNRLGTVNVPEECKDKTFCTVKPDDYPQELFDNLFEGTFEEQPFQPTPVMTSDRDGDPDANDEDNCEATVLYEPLYIVKTTLGDWRTVVQAPAKNFVQTVRIETCKNAGSPCFTDAKLPNLFTTLCKQKYSVWEFLALDHTNYGTKKVQVALPFCCSCFYKNNALDN